MDLGPHAPFILGSYVTMLVIVGGLIGWYVLDGYRQARALAELEARGVKRRSSERE